MSIILFNDIGMMPYYGYMLVYVLLLYICMILWHEAGHGIMFWKYDQKIKYYPYYDSVWKFGMNAGTQDDYDKITMYQYKMIGIVGIITGLVPLLITIFFNTSDFPLWLMIIPYGFAIWSDIEEIILKDVHVD